MTEFGLLSSAAKENLEQLAIAVEGVLPEKECVWTIKTGVLQEGAAILGMVNAIKEWAGDDGLYIYLVSLDSEDSVNAAREAFSKAKIDKSRGRAYARINGQSSCLYVGSSAKVYQRVKEHLGYGAKGTYSLHLSAWSVPLNLPLTLHCAKYPASTPPALIQILEDTLWSKMRPMFGRQGAR